MKLAERLAQEIVQEITTRGLKPGDRLPSEVQMAEERGVSRTSLREALRILEVHGLITIRTGPNGGPVLVTLTASDFARMATLHFHMAGVTFRQLLDARQRIEPWIAELAATNRTEEQIAQMRRNLAEHERSGEARTMVDYSHEFHTLVAECAGEGNRALALMSTSLQAIFNVYASESRTVSFLRRAWEEHVELCDLIEAGEGVKARELMTTHMQYSADTFADDHPAVIDRPVPWLSA